MMHLAEHAGIYNFLFGFYQVWRASALCAHLHHASHLRAAASMASPSATSTLMVLQVHVEPAFIASMACNACQ